MAKKKYPYCHPWHGDNPTFIFWMTRDEYRNRVRKIKECKPPHEVPIRLAIFKEVDISLLPKWLIKTRAAYDKADAAYDKADAAYDKALTAYDKACGKHRSELEKLHKKICGCKYWNGREVVFPQAGGVA